jgi:hypothetical protein
LLREIIDRAEDDKKGMSSVESGTANGEKVGTGESEIDEDTGSHGSVFDRKTFQDFASKKFSELMASVSQ